MPNLRSLHIDKKHHPHAELSETTPHFIPYRKYPTALRGTKSFKFKNETIHSMTNASGLPRGFLLLVSFQKIFYLLSFRILYDTATRI